MTRFSTITALAWCLSICSPNASAALFAQGELGYLELPVQQPCDGSCRGILGSTPYVSTLAGITGPHVALMGALSTTRRRITRLTMAQLQLDAGGFFLRLGRPALPFGNFLLAQSIAGPSRPFVASSYLLTLHDVLALPDYGGALEYTRGGFSSTLSLIRPTTLTGTSVIPGTAAVPPVLLPGSPVRLPPNLLQLLGLLPPTIRGTPDTVVEVQTRRRVYAGDVTYATSEFGLSADLLVFKAEREPAVTTAIVSARAGLGDALLSTEALEVVTQGARITGVDAVLATTLSPHVAGYAFLAAFGGAFRGQEAALGVVWRFHDVSTKLEVRELLGAAQTLGAARRNATVVTLGLSYRFDFNVRF